MESERNEDAKVHDGRRAWRLLRFNPDYVADWRANGGPVAHEPPPFPLRTQTVADLEAGRWNLLAWEAPWLNEHDLPFWAGVPMLKGSALDVGEFTEHALFRVVVRSGATFWGLQLRDGGLILKVMRGRRAAQIRVKGGKAFDPARSGLEIAEAIGGFLAVGGHASRAWMPSSGFDSRLDRCRRAGHTYGTAVAVTARRSPVHASFQEGGAPAMSMGRWRRTRGERRWSVFEDWAALDHFDAMDFRQTASRDGAATVEFGMIFVVDAAEGQRAWQIRDRASMRCGIPLTPEARGEQVRFRVGQCAMTRVRLRSGRWER